MTPTKKTSQNKAKNSAAKETAKENKTGSDAVSTKTALQDSAPKTTSALSKRKLKQQQKPRTTHQVSAERKKRTKLQQKLAQKKHPVFRGRFGKPNVRRKSIKKWQKWRKWRGIDIRKSVHHGFRPDSGYRTKSALRGMHPSGFFETTVFSTRQLQAISPQTAVRIAAMVGKKNRKQILAQAKQKGIRVLN